MAERLTFISQKQFNTKELCQSFYWESRVVKIGYQIELLNFIQTQKKENRL